MKRTLTAKAFIQLLHARLQACSSVVPDDRRIAIKHSNDENVWLLQRSSPNRAGEGSLFESDDLALTRIKLRGGAEIELFIRVRQTGRGQYEVAHYRIAFFNLPENPNRVRELRYDQSQGMPAGSGWDEDLEDNPEHPWAHLHVNFLDHADANALWLVTGPVCPIVLLRNLNHWYYETFLR